MALPDRTLCWVEGPPWDRYCTPVDELITVPLDVGALRARLNELDNAEMGSVLGVLLGVLSHRGVDLNHFLPNLSTMVLSDPGILEGLRAADGA